MLRPGRRRDRSATERDCSHCSKSALAKAITASSRSGSWVTSALLAANAWPKSLAGVRSSLIGAIDAERAAAGTVLTIFPAGSAAGHEILDPAALGLRGRGVGRRPAGHVDRHRLGRRVVELGAAALRAGVVVADHLLLDLVDLRLDARILAGRRFRSAGLGVVEARGAEGGDLLARQALAADLAQHVELALADEIVAALPLDHRLQLALGVVAFASVLDGRIELGPVRGRIGHELDDLAKETRRVFGFRHRRSRQRRGNGLGER